MQQRKQKLLCVLCVFHDNADRLWLLCDVLWDNYDMFVYYLANIHTNKLNVHRWSQQTPRKITIVIVVCWLTVVKCAFSPLDSPNRSWGHLIEARLILGLPMMVQHRQYRILTLCHRLSVLCAVDPQRKILTRFPIRWQHLLTKGGYFYTETTPRNMKLDTAKLLTQQISWYQHMLLSSSPTSHSIA